jgi:hypothetical protein
MSAAIMLEWLGPLLLIVTLAGAIASLRIASPLWRLGAMVVAGAAALVPIGGIPATQFVYSVTGPLSAASLTLLGSGFVALLRPRKPAGAFTAPTTLAAMILLIAVPLYVFELTGRGPDLYIWGYGEWPLPALLGAILLVAFWRGGPAVAAWLILAGALYLSRAYASANLFDYLVDPVAALLALIVLGRAAVARRRAEAQGAAMAADHRPAAPA